MNCPLAIRFTFLKRQTLNHSRKSLVAALVSFLVPFSLLAAKPVVSAPTGVNATVASCNQVDVSWQASTSTYGNSTISQYTVYRNGVQIDTVAAASTSYLDKTVTSSTTYSYTISATDSGGRTSSSSSPANVTTPSCGPTVPGNVSASALSCSRVNVSWIASTDSSGTITHYNVYRNGVSFATVSAPSTSFSDTSVVASSTYNYTVSATDSAGFTSAQSTTASATTPACADTTPPTVPANVVATAVNCTSVSVSWSASTDTGSGVHQYNIYRNGSLISIVAAPATSFVDSTVAASTSYAYTISATDVAGNTSALSAQASVSTPSCGDSSPPSVPTGVTPTAVSCSEVTLSWNASTDTGSGVKQYNIYRNGALLITVSAPSTSTYDASVVASSSYSYTVSATDNAGNTSAQSTAAGITVPACPSPTVPGNLSASAVSCSQVNVSWSASTDPGSTIKQYNVYRNGALLTTVSAPTTSYSDTSVAGSTTYSYTVSATDNAGVTSKISAAANATTPACTTGPTTPGNVSASAANCSQINISWSASTDTGSTIKQYNVYRNGGLLTTVSAATTSYSDTSVAASTTYSYTVSATDNAGKTSTQSAAANATTPACADNTPPTVPTNVVATALSCSNVSLSWAASIDTGSGVRQYNIYRDGALINIVSAPATSVLDTSVSPSTAYSYTISATDAAGNTSALSASAPVTTPTCGGPCTVTVNVSASTGGTASGGGTVNCGSSVTVNAAANSCYQFVNWTANGAVVSTSASYTFAPGASEIIVANFAPNTYTISTGVSPASSGTVSGGGTANCGSSVTVVASPASGYVFTNWTENGVVLGTSASYNFTASANRNLVANFVVASCSDTIGTAASPAAGGSTSGGGTVSCGSSVTVRATANSCYSFVNWTLNGAVVSTSASYTFAANANQTLTANFTPITYTVSTSPAAGGTASGGGTVNCGSSVTVTATANSCYSFVNWTLNGAVVSTSANYTFTPTASETLTANFTQTTYTVSTASSPSAGGTTSGGGTVTCGNSVNVSASPASGYTFSSWTQNGTAVSTSSTYTFTPSASGTLTANFTAAACTYSLSSSSASFSSSGGSGSVTVTAGSSCSWTANSGASWITITSGSSGTGNGTVNYSVAANTGSSTLTGTITIAGKTFTVTEAAGASTPGKLMWLRTNAPAYQARVNGIATDHSGNVIAVGQFYNSVDFGSGQMTSVGGSDAFIAKYNPQGALLWVKDIGGVYYDVAQAVAIDSQNNIIVAGSFQGSASFDGTSLTATGGSSDEDVFVVKLSPGSSGVPGTTIWARNYGSGANDYANGVAVDGGDNVFVTSESGGTVNFGNGISLTGHGGYDVALVKLQGVTAGSTAAGSTLWAQLYGGTLNDIPNALAVDRNGDVLVTGSFGGSGNLGGTPLAGSAASGIFVAKYSGTNGAYKWSWILSGFAGYGVTADPSTANVFITGQGNSGFFVNAYDTSGNPLWTETYGNGGDAGYAIAADGNGNLALTGICGSVDWLGNFIYSNGAGYFVASLTTSGTVQWDSQSNDSAAYGYAVGYDTLGHVITAGDFEFTANLSGVSITSGTGVYNAFIVQYDK